MFGSLRVADECGARKKKVAEKTDALRLYLVHLRSDAQEADQLETKLAADFDLAAEASPSSSAPVLFSRPLARGTPAELRIDHETKLRSSDVIVVMCAHADAPWVAAKRQELRRAGTLSAPPEQVVFYLPPAGISVSPYSTAGSLPELLAIVPRRRP